MRDKQFFMISILALISLSLGLIEHTIYPNIFTTFVIGMAMTTATLLIVSRVIKNP